MLNRGFVHRRRWQGAAFIILGVALSFAGNSVFERIASAQSASATSAMVVQPHDQFPVVAQPATPESPDQHRNPAPPVAVPSKAEPSAPLVAPVDPKGESISPKLSQGDRNEIIERHSGQLKSKECSRKLEERRRALRQRRASSHSGR